MKIDLIFLIIIGLFVFYSFSQEKETMADIGNIDQIKEAVKQVYAADVEAIRNLSAVATQLQAGGLTVPGNLITKGAILTEHDISHPDKGDGAFYRSEGQLNIASDDLIRFRSSTTKQTKIEMNVNDGSLKLGSWTIKENPHGNLMFLKDGAKYDNDYWKIPQDTGFIVLSQDGNIWSNRSTGRGWLADNKLNVSGGNVGSLNINGNLSMNGRIALNDNPIMIRSMGDENHHIKWNRDVDGPMITGYLGVGIKKQSDANPINLLPYLINGFKLQTLTSHPDSHHLNQYIHTHKNGVMAVADVSNRTTYKMHPV